MNAAIEPPHELCDICMFGAERHISKRHSALAVLTRPDKAPKEKKTRATLFVWRGARVVTTLPTESQRYRGTGLLNVFLKDRGCVFVRSPMSKILRRYDFR